MLEFLTFFIITSVFSILIYVFSKSAAEKKVEVEQMQKKINEQKNIELELNKIDETCNSLILKLSNEYSNISKQFAEEQNKLDVYYKKEELIRKQIYKQLKNLVEDLMTDDLFIDISPILESKGAIKAMAVSIYYLFNLDETRHNYSTDKDIEQLVNGILNHINDFNSFEELIEIVFNENNSVL